MLAHFRFPTSIIAHIQDNVPAMVMDGLWIGSIHAAFNQDSMQDRGITHVSSFNSCLASCLSLARLTPPLRDRSGVQLAAAESRKSLFRFAVFWSGIVQFRCGLVVIACCQIKNHSCLWYSGPRPDKRACSLAGIALCIHVVLYLIDMIASSYIERASSAATVQQAGL